MSEAELHVLGARLIGGIPAPAWALRQTSAEVVAEIDRLLGDYTDVPIARVLTQNGFRSGMGKAVNPMMVARVRAHYHLKSR